MTNDNEKRWKWGRGILWFFPIYLGVFFLIASCSNINKSPWIIFCPVLRRVHTTASHLKYKHWIEINFLQSQPTSLWIVSQVVSIVPLLPLWYLDKVSKYGSESLLTPYNITIIIISIIKFDICSPVPCLWWILLIQELRGPGEEQNTKIAILKISDVLYNIFLQFQAYICSLCELHNTQRMWWWWSQWLQWEWELLCFHKYWQSHPSRSVYMWGCLC